MEPVRLDSTARVVGRMEEYMRHAQTEMAEVKGVLREHSTALSEIRSASKAHNIQSEQTAKDIGEVRAAMSELHACLIRSRNQKATMKGRWKYIGIGAVASVGVLSFIVAIAAGRDGDLLLTLSRILGVLL